MVKNFEMCLSSSLEKQTKKYPNGQYLCHFHVFDAHFRTPGKRVTTSIIINQNSYENI